MGFSITSLTYILIGIENVQPAAGDMSLTRGVDCQRVSGAESEPTDHKIATKPL